MTVKSFYLAPLLILIALVFVFNSCTAPKYYDNDTATSSGRPLLNNLSASRPSLEAAPGENTTLISGLPCASVGCMAPDFSLPTTDQKQLTLSSLKGKKVILAFLSTTCNACIKTVQCLLPIYASWPRDQLEMVFVVSVEQVDDVQFWINAYGIKCPVALDSWGKVLNQYKPDKTPALYFLTADGTIQARKYSPIDGCTQEFDALLRQY